MSCEELINQLGWECTKLYQKVSIIWESCRGKVKRAAERQRGRRRFDPQEAARAYIDLLKHWDIYYGRLLTCLKAVASEREDSDKVCHTASEVLIPCLRALIHFFKNMEPIANSLRRHEGRCDVRDLKPLKDPLALEMERKKGKDVVILENLKPEMWKALQNFEKAVKKCGGTFKITSAYRPKEYQAHLREVWDKYQLLKKDDCPECKELKKKVTREFKEHKLRYRPARRSKHCLGVAADIVVSVPKSCGKTVDQLAQEAGLYRPLPKRDPIHFQLRRRRSK
jgi:uncharacterized protein YcbK (DUF882 family)